MLKLIKYELRRNSGILGILAIVIAFIEAFTLFGLFTESSKLTSIGFVLLTIGGMVGFFMVFIMAIVSYSKELGSKESYMTFMTPVSTYKIIGSKLLTTGVVALLTTIAAIILIVVDFNLFIAKFSDIAEMKESFEQMFSIMGYNLGELIFSVFVQFVVFWLSIFTTICLAYLAITLSATVFANKRGRGFISFLIFVAINIAISYLGTKIPMVEIGSGNMKEILAPLLSYLANVVIMIASFLGTGLLLDKKVSL